MKRPSLSACRNWGQYRALLRYRVSQFTGALNQRHFNRVFEWPMQNPIAGNSRRAFGAVPSAGARSRRSSGCARPYWIKKTARRDPILGAAGAVLFIEKVSPALEHVDSSSGAIGTAVNHAIEGVGVDYREGTGGSCQAGELAGASVGSVNAGCHPLHRKARGFLGRAVRSQGTRVPLGRQSHRASSAKLGKAWRRFLFPGHASVFLLAAGGGKVQTLLELLETAPSIWWEYRRWGVRALLAMGRADEAIRYAEAPRGLNDNPELIARACEEILLSLGRSAEAYERYAIAANRGTSYVAAFRAIVRKYPAQEPQRILRDLVARTPGQEGKWFAAAKEAGLLEMAIGLANQSPCDPKTLTRAARDLSNRIRSSRLRPAWRHSAGLARASATRSAGSMSGRRTRTR